MERFSEGSCLMKIAVKLEMDKKMIKYLEVES